MQLHQLKPQYKNKGKKRVGRGGKRGTYSGKGAKGQKSRAGHRIRPALRDTLIRIPKLRGFKNKPLQPQAVAINIEKLKKLAEKGIVKINITVLIENGLIKKSDKRVKILGKGEINKPLQIEELDISQPAQKKIEAAGGKIVQK